MKRKSIYTRAIPMLLCGAMLSGILAGCQSGNTENPATSTIDIEQSPAASSEALTESENALDWLDDVEVSRINYLNAAEMLKVSYQQNPSNTDIALAYAEKLLQLGSVDEAEAVLSPVYTADSTNPKAILLSAKAAYLKGDYEQSEKLYDTLLDGYPEFRAEAEFGIQFVYYQTNQYAKAQQLSGNYEGRTGITKLMQAYGDKEPYRVTWDGAQENAIPFVVSEPLPVVELEMNGVKRYFILDTGASDTYLNESVANELGLEIVSSQTAPYAGGIEVVTNYGIVDSLRLGGVTVENIPVNIANMDHLADIAGEEYEICGVIGIGIYKQFLVTVDYLNSELVLKPRGEHLAADPNAYEAPFILAELHFTMCKAFVNGKEINSWTDSGLATDASLLLTDGAIEYIGISAPDKVANDSDDGGGLGGSEFDIAEFTVDTYDMGNLPTVKGMKTLSGILIGSGYEEEIEIFMDAIISHNYLKDYVWTMDFDSMTMTFAK